MRLYHNVFDDPDQLHHHGILGMKWGIRRSRKELGHDTGTSKKRKKKTGEKTEREREEDVINLYKNRDKMTTKQLQAKVNRIKTERELERLAYEKEAARNAEAQKIAEAKRKRNVMLLTTAIDIASSLPLESKINLGKEAFYENGVYNEKAHRNAEAGLKSFVKAAQGAGPGISKMLKAANGLKQSSLSKEDVYIPGVSRGDELHHYGVIGMHWGVRKAARAKTAPMRFDIESQKKAVKMVKNGIAKDKYQLAKIRASGRNSNSVNELWTLNRAHKAVKFDIKEQKKELKSQKEILRDKKRAYRYAYREVYHEELNRRKEK